MRTGYLFLYNMIQWGGWVMILADVVLHMSFKTPRMTEYGSKLVYIFQAIALMELVHAITGLVRASPVTTFIQIFGRMQVLIVHYFIAEARLSKGNFPMVAAWALVEIVRYLYLALNVIGFAPRILLWLRYSLFYVLYPIGVYGEMKVLYDSLAGIERTNFLSKSFPNQWNLGFSFATYIRFFLLVLYIPGLINQYRYMMKQRRIVLAKSAGGVKSQ